MPKYRVYMQYVGYGDTIIEAASKADAIEAAYDNFDFSDFDGKCEVEDIIELDDDEA